MCLARVLNSIRCPGHGAVIGRPADVSVSIGNWMLQLADSILDSLLEFGSDIADYNKLSDIVVYVKLGSDITVYANDDNMSVFPAHPVKRTAQASVGVLVNNDLLPIDDDITPWAHMSALRIHE
eukprot:12054535-Heterocapsa_arctica.AAC.1